MYSNNFSNFGASAGMGSQNQGFRQFQPTGNVQSVYGQNAGQGNQGYGQNAGQGNQGYGQTASSSYQTANYRGNQQGHDAGLRADSLNPSQMQSGGFGTAGASGNYGGSNNYNSVRYGIRGNETGGLNNVSSQFGFNQNPYSSMGQSGYGNQGFGSTNYSSSGMMNQGMGQSNFGQSGYGNQGASFGQGTEAFHTANYRGNQQGHDAGLRADSLSPLQQGGGTYSETNYGSPSYGIRGHENINSGLNNVSSQFGFSQGFQNQ
jgi:hypothetical protein